MQRRCADRVRMALIALVAVCCVQTVGVRQDRLKAGARPAKAQWSPRPCKMTQGISSRLAQRPRAGRWGKITAFASDRYDYSKPTYEHYGDGNKTANGPFAYSRKRLDYSYHPYYRRERRLLQDQIVLKYLKEGQGARACSPDSPRWVVFTAGAMGSGKSHTMEWLSSNGLFPLSHFLWVDPDELRPNLPEWQGYLNADPERAVRLMQRETGMLSEVLVLEALKRDYNVVIDGTLRDYKWYMKQFEQLRAHHPNYRIGILHIRASLGAIKQRVKSRARKTGRVVPEAEIEASFRQVPESVGVLAPLADFFAQICNEDGRDPVLIEPATWHQFHDTWKDIECDLDGDGDCRAREGHDQGHDWRGLASAEGNNAAAAAAGAGGETNPGRCITVCEGPD